jgi:hypothetical protein
MTSTRHRSRFMSAPRHCENLTSLPIKSKRRVTETTLADSLARVDDLDVLGCGVIQLRLQKADCTPREPHHYPFGLVRCRCRVGKFLVGLFSQ